MPPSLRSTWRAASPSAEIAYATRTDAAAATTAVAAIDPRCRRAKVGALTASSSHSRNSGFLVLRVADRDEFTNLQVRLRPGDRHEPLHVGSDQDDAKLPVLRYTCTCTHTDVPAAAGSTSSALSVTPPFVPPTWRHR